MTTPPNPPKRFLIGAVCFADAQPALRLAERLVETLNGDLGGLLVEETIVTEVADLPGQRVVTTSGAVVVAPTREQVRTLIESDAKAFRDRLSGLAERKARKWSFERLHGDLVSGLCALAKGSDILLLGHRQIHHRTGKVVVIAPPETAPQRAVDLARDLATSLQTDLVSVSLDREQGAASGRFASDAALLDFLNRAHVSAVVLDLSAGPLRTQDQLRQVMAVARCPVLVLGADVETGTRDAG